MLSSNLFNNSFFGKEMTIYLSEHNFIRRSPIWETLKCEKLHLKMERACIWRRDSLLSVSHLPCRENLYSGNAHKQPRRKLRIVISRYIERTVDYCPEFTVNFLNGLFSASARLSSCLYQVGTGPDHGFSNLSVNPPLYCYSLNI